jgi:hypothetical protein
MGVRRDLWLGERDDVAVTAGVGDRLGQLIRRHHALVDRDVGNLMRGVHVDPDDVRMCAQALLDTPGAAVTGECPGGDRERYEPLVSWSLSM